MTPGIVLESRAGMENGAHQRRPYVEVGPEFEQFANVLDDCLSSRLTFAQQKARLLDVPQKYYDNARRRLLQMQRALQQSVLDAEDMDIDGASDFSVTSEGQAEMDQLQREIETWDLFRRLLPLRYNTKTASHPNHKQPAEKQLSLVEYLQTDSTARERLSVLQWLQENAASRPDIDQLVQELQKNAGREDVIAHGWLHTRAAIKQRKSLTGWSHLLDQQSTTIRQSFQTKNGAPMATQLDPDVVLRQGRKLETQDEYFERAIWRGLFEHIRRGSPLQIIREWCEDRTELWRAVTATPFHFGVNDHHVAAGAPQEAICLWRRMCLATARNSDLDKYQRAVYGLLSGDIETVEHVSETWDDLLFANYNGLLRSQVDAFLLEQVSTEVKTTLTSSFGSFDAAQYIGHTENVGKHLVSALGKRGNAAHEITEPNKALQASLIGRDLDHHLASQGACFAKTTGGFDNSTDDGSDRDHQATISKKVAVFPRDQIDGIRIIAHVLVLNMILERPDPALHASPVRDVKQHMAQCEILAEYTKLLYKAELKALIPLYCGVLEEPACYRVMSDCLVEETDPEQRIALLNLMKKAGLDGLSFVRHQAERLYRALDAGNKSSFSAGTQFRILQDRGPLSIRFGKMMRPDFIAQDDEVLLEQHELAIRGLEWLKDCGRTWPQIFELGTKMYKLFYRSMHLMAARELKDRVSFASIMNTLGDDDALDSNYLDQVSFWAQCLEQNQIIDVSPDKVMRDARNFRELESLITALDNLETLASMGGLEVALHPTNRDFWTRVGTETKQLRQLMQPLLHGWLEAGIEEGDMELQEISRAYLPETVLAYISALQFAGTGTSRDHLLECMELASIIASRDRAGLVTNLQAAGRMRELVEAFAACSKALAFATGEKRTAGSGNKKHKEMGWSRDLWSVKS